MAEEEPVEAPAAKQGVFVFPNGARYDGTYEMKPEHEPAEGETDVPMTRVRHGTGVYKLDGNVYEGEWVQDRMHGHGLFKFMGGDVYDGDWVQDQFHGQGKYKWKNGAYYIGAWESNKMHGEGMFVDTEGRQWKGRFFNGQGPGLHTLPTEPAEQQQQQQ
eukprot:CAMPEP_0181340288 /NCGR_PEP_ID=MMETSP1101-20121128/29756_1 /TAXON_ID=46948 /ORGANISM="Rhodomonas abbreviata, Strain Caron Lab Isolate" /LENGTH=159 /DNA_ID=CAMNT_0023451407 /DNA_START=13 /DNA_END=492 /DNA_ORIENTATION=-